MTSGGGPRDHPVDLLIRELLEAGRAATTVEADQIIERMATAEFSRRIVSVLLRERGRAYGGIVLEARTMSLGYHLVKRVAIEEQWAAGTDGGQYLADLERAVRSQDARLVVYQRRGEHFAAVISPTEAAIPPERMGKRSLAHMIVIYSADWGTIISGYQFSSLSELALPETLRWLR